MIPKAFTSLCPNCNRIVDVIWHEGHYVYSPHPPKLTVCSKSMTEWRYTTMNMQGWWGL